MSFVETRFPRPPRLGYTSAPTYDVTVTALAGGAERRNRNWSRPLHEFTFETAGLDVEVAPLVEFFHAMGGRAYGFRFKDWNDYQSCAPGGTPAPTDQPATELTSTTFQLVKRYQAGAQVQDRDIVKPVAGTVRVAVDDVEVLTGWTLNTATGVVTFDSAPGGTVTWGGEFDVPVRFDADSLPVELSFRDDSGSYVQDLRFTLRELRNP